MRKLWFRRKAVSTMIGGIIVLTIFLVALASMVVVSQQNDAYQGTVKQMAQKDVDRNAENLQIVYPGISFPPAATGVSCAGAGSCDEFTMTISNVAGIGTQVARIYINSTTECKTLCILDPTGSPTDSSFNTNDEFINPSEPNHLLHFWMATNMLTNQTTHQVNVVTTRGRVFSFTWPFPTSGQSVPTGSLYIGCLAIDFDDLLATYTEYSPTVHQIPARPLAGGWLFPGSNNLLFYVRVSNICTANVTLLDKSTFYAIQYTGAGGGAAPAFYIASPMDVSYCQTYFLTVEGSIYCGPGASASPGNTFPDSHGNVLAYNASLSACSYPSNPCYNIPAAPEKGKQSKSVYVLFGANGPCFSSTCSGGWTAGNTLQGTVGGTYVVFLAIYWQCVTGGDTTCTQGYEFGVTLPFISIQTCDPSGSKPPACT
jgi:hypothetical protein